MAVVADFRMVTWLLYRTAEWSRGCGTVRQNGHVAVVPDCRIVTCMWYWTAEIHVAVVTDCRMVTLLW